MEEESKKKRENERDGGENTTKKNGKPKTASRNNCLSGTIPFAPLIYLLLMIIIIVIKKKELFKSTADHSSFCSVQELRITLLCALGLCFSSITC